MSWLVEGARISCEETPGSLSPISTITDDDGKGLEDTASGLPLLALHSSPSTSLPPVSSFCSSWQEQSAEGFARSPEQLVQGRVGAFALALAPKSLGADASHLPAWRCEAAASRAMSLANGVPQECRP